MNLLWLAAVLAARCPAVETIKPVELPAAASAIPAALPAANLAPAAPQATVPQAAIPPAEPNAPPPVAPDFGAKNGTEITNKATILAEIDRALGQDKPPSLEFLWVRPLATPLLKFPRLSTETNPYGHAAVRYTLPDGTQKVMNIVGLKGREMVNFLKPEEYLYGTRVFDGPSEQGGLYNRGMFSVRVEKLPDEQILALDKYYEELKVRAERGEAGFSLALSDVLNFLARLTPGVHEERGNCARWCSMGLAAGGILKSASLWPKKIWTTLFERHRRADPANVHVIAYRRVQHAVRTYGANVDAHGLVAPFHWLADRRYWDLENYADALVEVPEGTMTAKATTRAPAWRRK